MLSCVIHRRGKLRIALMYVFQLVESSPGYWRMLTGLSGQLIFPAMNEPIAVVVHVAFCVPERVNMQMSWARVYLLESI